MTRPSWSGSEDSTTTGRFSKRSMTRVFIVCGNIIFFRAQAFSGQDKPSSGRSSCLQAAYTVVISARVDGEQGFPLASQFAFNIELYNEFSAEREVMISILY
jgi:hypothetical protein